MALSTSYPALWCWVFMPDPLHPALQLCEAGMAAPILERRRLRFKIMEKDHTFLKRCSQGSYVASLALTFAFPLFLLCHVALAPLRLSFSKNVPKSKDRVMPSCGPTMCTLGDEDIGVRKPRAWAVTLPRRGLW